MRVQKISLISLLLVTFIAAYSYTVNYGGCLPFDQSYYCESGTPYNWEEPSSNAVKNDQFVYSGYGDFHVNTVFDMYLANGNLFPSGSVMDMDTDSILRIYACPGSCYASLTAGFPSYTRVSGGFRAHEVLGTAPNRRHIFTWSGVTSNNEPHRAQIKFFEATKNYEFHFNTSYSLPNYSFYSGLEHYSSDTYVNWPLYYLPVMTPAYAFGLYRMPQPSGSTCGNNVVEGSEQCDGGSCCQADCTFTTSSDVCRASVGECDLAEYCSGVSSECPIDSFNFEGVPCRENFGVCDVYTHRTCTGSSATCSGLPIPSLESASVNWLSYNVISFGDITGNTGAIGGRAAAKNQITFGQGFSVGYGVNYQTGPGSESTTRIINRFSLLAGHAVTWGDGSLYPDMSVGYMRTEGMFAGDSFTGPSYLGDRVTGSIALEGRNLDGDFESAQAYYRSISDNLAIEVSNVVVTSQWSGLFLNCSDSSDRYVAYVDSAELNAATWFSVDPSCNYASAFVINVIGSGEVQFNGGSFPGIIEKVLFNIRGAGRTVKIASGVAASILAVDNDVVQTGGNTNGIVIANSISGISSTTNPSCSDFLPFDIITFSGSNSDSGNRARDVADSDKAGSDLLQVKSFSQIIVGDVCTITGYPQEYTIQERIIDGGFYLRVEPALTNDILDGSQVVCNVADPSTPRSQDSITEVGVESSASLSIISFVVMMIALMI